MHGDWTPTDDNVHECITSAFCLRRYQNDALPMSGIRTPAKRKGLNDTNCFDFPSDGGNRNVDVKFSGSTKGVADALTESGLSKQSLSPALLPADSVFRSSQSHLIVHCLNEEIRVVVR